MADWQQEAQRWRQTAEQTQQQVQQLQQAVQWLGAQSQVRTLEGTRGPSKTPSAQEILDGYLRGDNAALQPLDQILSQAGAFDREKRRAETQEILGELLRPAQYVNAFQREHGEFFADAFKDVNGEMYRALMDEYETMAADPMARLKYDEKPGALSEWPMPGNVGKKTVDMRLMDDAALRLRLKRERDGGRKDEARRRNRPSVESSSGARTPSESSDTPLLTADERRFIRDHLRELPREWGRTEEAVDQHRWNKLLSPQEKARRQALRANGQWPG